MKRQIVLLSLICITGHLFAQDALGLHVAPFQTVLFGSDTIGSGAKLLWIPSKAAFRAGSVDGSDWNYQNIGFFSTAMGAGSTATRTGTTALGFFNRAGGNFSTALGASTIADSYASTVVGINNLSWGDPINRIETDPLFQVGNGASSTTRRNALTILKNGQMHIPQGQDASLSSHGFLMIGNPLGTNLIIDDNEIMARQNGGIANLHLNQDGGNLYLGGNVFLNVTPHGDRANLQLDIETGQIFWENSSLRFKENIHTLEDEWSKILHTRPVKYTRPGAENYWEYGYLAEEIDSIGLTNLVTYDTTGLPNNVNYEKMVLYLTELVKLQQNRLDQLDRQIEKLTVKRKHPNKQNKKPR